MSTTLRQQLLDVRSAILSIPQIQKEKEQVISKRNSTKFTLASPDNYQFERSRTADALERQFAWPFLKPYHEEADKKATKARNAAEASVRRSNRLKFASKLSYRVLFAIILIVLSLGVLVGGGFLSYIVANWSWETSIYEFMNSTYLGDSGFLREYAEGIHLMSLSFALIALCIPAIIVAWKIDENFVRIPLYIGGGIFGLAAIISIIASFFIFLSGESNFFLKILLVIPYLIFIPKAFFMWIYTMPFLLVPIATLTATAFAIFGCVKYIGSIYDASYYDRRNVDNGISEVGNAEYWRVYNIEYSKAPYVSMTELHNSKKYQDALEFDEKQDLQTLSQYRDYYGEQVEKHNELLLQYSNAIDQYDKLIKKCKDIIATATFLNAHEKNVETINVIIYYIDYRHATTVREALKDYEDDKHRMRMEQMMSDFTKEYNRRMAQVVQGLDDIQTDISVGLESINTTLNTNAMQLEDAMRKNIERIESSMEASRRQAARDADRIIENTGRIASNADYVSEVLRRYN